MTKSAQRTALRAARREIAAARDLAADAVAVADHVTSVLPAGTKGGDGSALVVLSYESLAHEPPTDVLNARLQQAGHRVLVPITLPSLDLDWHDLADPAKTPLGTQVPALADLVLAPGLAVDRAGTRLGQGGGCYDRVLPRLRTGTPVLVLLHPGELLDPGAAPLPREEHDAPVPAVVSADGVTTLTDAAAPPGRAG